MHALNKLNCVGGNGDDDDDDGEICSTIANCLKKMSNTFYDFFHFRERNKLIMLHSLASKD